MTVVRPLWSHESLRPTDKYWLDKNENKYLSTALVSYIYSKLDVDSFSTYPSLIKSYNLISEVFGISEINCLLCRGSDDAIGSLFKADSRFKNAVICRPSFAMNSVYPLNHGFDLKEHSYKLIDGKFSICFADLLHDVETLPDAITVLASPDSPTGTLYTVEDLQLLSKRIHPSSLLLIDATYSLGVSMSYLSELINISISHSNVLVVTSLSKYPGLAGCRIGFITGTESAIGFLRQVRPMYEIGSLSSNILNIALSSWDKCLDVVDQTNLCKINLETLLSQFDSPCLQTYGNFSLFYSSPALTSSLERLCTYRYFSGDGPLSNLSRLSTPPVEFIQLLASSLNEN